MLSLSRHINITRQIIDSPNICSEFAVEDLQKIGLWASDNYKRDVASRVDWERRTEAAMDLAMQVSKDKNFPWPNCANIAFPLVTIAAMQFHARAYPAIVNGSSVVQCKVVGEDPTGIATRRAKLIGQHMSWQVLEQDEAWEEQQDRALLNVAIVGVGWKKSYYDASLGHNISEFVSAKNLVVNYWAKDISTAQVKTHIIPLYKNDLHERIMRGSYRDVREESWYTSGGVVAETEARKREDARAGTVQPQNESDDTPYIMLEQHCYLDLDGDGYAEPYIITFEESSSCVVRIVARFNREEDIERTRGNHIVRIKPTEYFTKIPFIPSPDGGILDIGFGVLLGPLNESVNSAINQLFDAGTISNTAGGFLGRGAKIRGGVYEFKPFGWHRVDSTGDDLNKNIFPLPVREPSNVMFNLLSLIIDYTSRIAGSTDMMAGENPGQNTPAETSRAMLEQGQKIYSAIFKRIWRSMKKEFKKLYTLNAIYLPMESSFGDGLTIRNEDYRATAVSVIPVADPTIASEGARFAQARLLKEAAATAGGYDNDEVERRYLRALGVDDVDKIFPGSDKMAPPPPDVKVQIQQMKNELALQQMQQKQTEFILNMQENVRLNTAKIAELTAKANKLDAEATSEPGKQNVAAFRAGIEAMREQNAQANAHLDRLMESLNESRSSIRTSGITSPMEAGSNNQTLLGADTVPSGAVEGGLG
jgi:hypothetical protein